MSFNVLEAQEWVLQCHKIWNEVELQFFEKLTPSPIKGEGRYMHGKLETWKERSRTNFHGQDIPYDIYCNAIVVLTPILSHTLKSVNTLKHKASNVTI